MAKKKTKVKVAGSLTVEKSAGEKIKEELAAEEELEEIVAEAEEAIDEEKEEKLQYQKGAQLFTEE
jgi:hypothetical protein